MNKNLCKKKWGEDSWDRPIPGLMEPGVKQEIEMWMDDIEVSYHTNDYYFT